MKRTELEVGMIVAVKRGPASKDRYKAIVLDVRDWCEPDGGEDFVVKTASTPVKAYGFGPRTGIAIAKKRPYTPKGELPKWEPGIVPLPLIAEVWSAYEARTAQVRRERSDATRAEDAAFEARIARREAVEASLGLTTPKRGDEDVLTVTLADLEALAAKLASQGGLK